jgi:hypothetical protein
MIFTYYTLYLLLFDQMLSSRVPKSDSYRKKIDGNCINKVMQIIGAILVLGVIALNIVFLIYTMAKTVE